MRELTPVQLYTSLHTECKEPTAAIPSVHDMHQLLVRYCSNNSVVRLTAASHPIHCLGVRPVLPYPEDATSSISSSSMCSYAGFVTSTGGGSLEQQLAAMNGSSWSDASIAEEVNTQRALVDELYGGPDNIAEAASLCKELTVH